MAGSFGFETDHYSVSVACGERVLFPAVRKSQESTIIIADGFSCREQISQLTGKQARHTAEVLQLAIRPESAGSAAQPPAPAGRRVWAAAAAALGIAAFFLVRRMRRG